MMTRNVAAAPAIDASGYFGQLMDSQLLQIVLESWIDGILVLNDTGKLIHTNETARQICDRLQTNNSTHKGNSSNADLLPESIWQIYSMLIDSRTTFPNQPVVLEFDIEQRTRIIRVRARWFSLSESAKPYVLISLEDRYQSSLNRAMGEVDRYRLSPRESEVWMLFRTGKSYKEIAQTLYITVDTVKKHLKSIRLKQQDTAS